jgi:hypothetical protein
MKKTLTAIKGKGTAKETRTPTAIVACLYVRKDGKPVWVTVPEDK